MYEILEIIFKHEWSNLKREIRQTGVHPLLSNEITMMVESESTSSVQLKRKPKRLHQN